jgi:NAD(P)-dependent dehydrogenase (short-subunit alcohol dehydrogenase family)
MSRDRLRARCRQARRCHRLGRSARRPSGSIGAALLDVADTQAVALVGAAIQDRYERVDILVNSAGVNFAKRFWTDTDSATFAGVVAINLIGAAACTLAVLKGMQ